MEAQAQPISSLIDEYGVDLARPLFPQIEQMGDNYEPWVHQGVTRKQLAQLAAVQTGPWVGSVSIFSQDWLEPGTHIKWQHVLGLWAPVALLCVAAASFWQGMPVGAALGWAFFGFAVWTLVEYILHRVVFHNIPHNTLGRKIHFLAHGIHHLDPWDATRLVFPIPLAIGLSLLIFGSINLLAPLDRTLAIYGGLMIGYLIYDMSHYLSHHHKTQIRWLKFLKKYHLAHHHRDHDRYFGVSQPFWDLVFRTGSLKL